MDWLKISQMFQHIMIALAVITGGLWAYYQWRIQRAHETALEIDLISTCTAFENALFLVFIDVSLKNVGKRKLGAKAKEYVNGMAHPVYQDEVETLYHSLGLQIRGIKTDIKTNAALYWFNSNDLAPLQNIPDEINLLNDYEISKVGEEDMWIEPGETSHFGCAVILPKGYYLAKVTFVGTRKEIDFWCRLFYIHIPASEKRRNGEDNLSVLPSKEIQPPASGIG